MGFGSTSRVDGFGAPSVIASATAGAWSAAEDAAAPASSANALSATPSGAMLSTGGPANFCHATWAGILPRVRIPREPVRN